MNPFDTAILIVIGISALYGLWRGLVKEILSLVIWVVALVVARLHSGLVADMLSSLIENEIVRSLTAFCLLFLGVLIAGSLLIKLMDTVLTVTGLSLFDKMLGAIFGVARGAVIVLVCLYILNVFLSENTRWQDSSLIPYGMAMIQQSQEWIVEWQGDIDTVLQE
ncbi:MAG: CvpA family protein [Gammaproteobacteria bacterium]|nr:CvpA family protein [Gammaproteobacteria bacterium]MCY4357564.1 CvpA family protein [Gammaproteobacteria bacterium]